MKKLFLISGFIIISLLSAFGAEGAGPSLYLAPSQGSFFAGSTFSVSIYVDTKGQKINVLEIGLKFSPDVLQVASPTTGESFISEWLIPPSYSNSGGIISFKGGIPEGIATSAGLVSTITFRAKAPGKSRVEFSDVSKVYLADGKGTPVLTNNFRGVYEVLVLPPEGPKISSSSHPDSDLWYSNSSPNFFWEKEQGVSEFSYSFSGNPQENPDTFPEGAEVFKSYENVGDGIWYFHLRAKKEGVWGRTSRLAVKIDTAPPENFEPKIDIYNGFVYFETKDLHSGLDHYEIAVLNISQDPSSSPFFIETTSPYKIPYEEPGRYKTVIRAYDRVGNIREKGVEFQKLSAFISVVQGRGVQIKKIFISWPILIIAGFFALLILVLAILFLERSKTSFKKGLREIDEALEEIKKIEEKELEGEKLKQAYEEKKEKLEEELR